MLKYLKPHSKIIILILFVINVNATLAQEPVQLLTLDDAIEMAVSNNHSLKISEIQVDISKARVRDSKSQYYPQLESKIVVPFVERESGFFLDQLIWDFGRTSNIVKSTKFQLEASRFSYDETLNDTIQNTTISYYTALTNKHFLEAAELDLKKKELIFEKIKELNRIGRSSNIELTQAKSDTGNARLELLRQKNQFEISKMELLDFIGAEHDAEVELVDNEEVLFKQYNLDIALMNAVNRSPMLRKIDAEQSASMANAKAAKSEFYPVIFGRTAYRFEGEGGEDFPGFIAGFGFTFPIFEGFSRFARLDIRNAESTRSLIEYEKSKKNIQTEVKRLFMDLEFNRQKIDITHTNKKVAEENLNLIKERYNLGTASQIELVDAELFYAESNSNYLQSIYNYKITEIKFLAITGEL